MDEERVHSFLKSLEKRIKEWDLEIKDFMDGCEKDMLFILIPYISESPFKIFGLIREDGEWKLNSSKIHLASYPTRPG